ncbi:hypothetical protein ACFQBQ_12255 [Granulicella cerasi]|uniref:Uncharacterized protein n=1 Tax=Granulicella cerasi TaxID=741063 RepID=A0ABW1ZDS5_9BACT
MNQTLRPVYMVLSPRSLDYARLAIATLLAQSADALHLHLITDSDDDRDELQRVVTEIAPPQQHRVSVFSEHDLDAAEEERLGRYPHLRALRHGHPAGARSPTRCCSPNPAQR